ncbi:MAG: deoxyribose-phosphate aldolase, partial [Eubacteriaceae bacterium]|nr:deoxyribose-phosphate aldolase [Eubacteriaceae bacterium]
MEWTKKTVAGAVDLALLKPGMTQEELRAGLKAAIRLGCASACVRGCDIREAEAILRGTQTMLSAVVAFPHGGASTEAKAFEAAHYAKAGAREIDFVIAVGMAASGDYAYVAHDMESVAFAAHAEGSIVKAIFECCL